ncbi:2-amino-4-hydroxy-6-hydroxymethyldihydropteridine diphosphokinase [Mangrovactinospora gilvigrisea]|uniref:2-amino-4-hydroxy-6-hydroxymethyldihydropteridine diphosphokinase n=1 Tax=Mangrovactinospora gilvigrisea TaxID=1428644 RepID=A0A1J7CBN2_9ACTN|nr:2-amino-4-hydroxy-6-hydroxymethyldihydropteridine diphosphokinase [Mangrovactinospora gilvigrisea]OIV38920.1 2-amino-4-hydroxy-6-hydroxymethyldihydropteridine diphosphokinase [Mangrovactinospora gilvigrisea]
MSSDRITSTSPVHPKIEEAVDAADSTLQNPRRAVLALGANLGNRLENLQGAVDALEDTPGVRVKAVSAVYETEPLGGPDEQPAFFNAVVLLKTTLPASALLERANAIEDAYGRVREERWGPRTLDVDIINFDGRTSEDARLTLPHPRAHERAFVLVPWLDADPMAELPGHGPIKDLAAAVDTAGVRRREDLALVLPR